MKEIKFSEDLVKLIKDGSKTSTWRLFDDKDLKTGEKVVFLARPSLSPFAEAVLSEVLIKKFSALTEADKEGHEKFASNEEMYKTYEGYYGRPVNADTELKIIHFSITKWL